MALSGPLVECDTVFSGKADACEARDHLEGLPGFDVDVFVETTKLSFSAAIMGQSTIDRECEQGRLFITGDAAMLRSIKDWFPRSESADLEGIVQLPDLAQAADL